jgi:hypothetical protein
MVHQLGHPCLSAASTSSSSPSCGWKGRHVLRLRTPSPEGCGVSAAEPVPTRRPAHSARSGPGASTARESRKAASTAAPPWPIQGRSPWTDGAAGARAPVPQRSSRRQRRWLSRLRWPRPRRRRSASADPSGGRCCQPRWSASNPQWRRGGRAPCRSPSGHRDRASAPVRSVAGTAAPLAPRPASKPAPSAGPSLGPGPLRPSRHVPSGPWPSL